MSKRTDPSQTVSISSPEGIDSIPVSALESRISRTLSSLCLEYRRIGAEINERKETQKELKEQIEVLALSLPYKSIVGEGWSTRREQRTISTLNRSTLAIEASKVGYDPITVLDLVKSATEEKPVKEFVKVLAGGEIDTNGEEEGEAPS